MLQVAGGRDWDRRELDVEVIVTGSKLISVMIINLQWKRQIEALNLSYKFGLAMTILAMS